MASASVPSVEEKSSDGDSRVKFGIAKTVDEKIELITRNLDEILGEEAAIAKMRSILEKRDLRIYWGTATTGKPHVAYFVPMTKIADFLRAGCHVTILFADLHAFLDNLKAPWDLLKLRVQYYREAITGILESIGVPLDRLHFVQGTDYQLSREYTLDVYKLASITSERHAKRAGAEVVKQVSSPLLSGLMYPLLQALDEEYLKVDAQFGGVDQRKIFVLAEEFLPKLGYGKRIHLMNPMVPGLTGDKMSASEINSKIDLLDSQKVIRQKIGKAFCEEGNIENNGVLTFAKMVLFPLLGPGEQFVIRRKPEHGGDLTYGADEVERLVEDFAEKRLHPLDLKLGVTDALGTLLEPIRKKFSSKQLRQLNLEAYPEEASAAAAAAGGGPKKKMKKGGGKKGKAAGNISDAGRLCILVGRVKEVEIHPEAESCFVSQVDIGSEQPIQVVSKATAFHTLEEMQGRDLVLLTNIRPGRIVGRESLGMALGVTGEDSGHLLQAPEGCKPGDRLVFAGEAVEEEPSRVNEKVLKRVLPELSIGEGGVVQYKETSELQTSTGVPVTAPETFVGAKVQ